LPIVTASYDPNNKTVEPAGNISYQDLLTYQINFQNTGNDTAFTILVRDTLTTMLDPNTFRFIGASHPVSVSIKNGNILEFRFDQILLPDSTTDEPNSHGYTIYPVSGLVPNSIIRNSAAIYFDFNIPIITNSTLNTIGVVSGLSAHASSYGLITSVNPNPFATDAILSVECQEKGVYMLSIYTSEGKIAYCGSHPTNSIRISRSNLSSGLYFYEVRTPSGLFARGRFLAE
jgi:uncharacterized repeat protein (TIGR01451 family)